MSKKKTGLLIAFGASIGAAAAAISYYLKYKSFSDELDKDFHDYEDEDSSSEETEEKADADTKAGERTYITLDPGKCRSAAQEKSEDAHEDPRPSAAVTVEEDTEGAGE